MTKIVHYPFKTNVYSWMTLVHLHRTLALQTQKWYKLNPNYDYLYDGYQNKDARHTSKEGGRKKKRHRLQTRKV